VDVHATDVSATSAATNADRLRQLPKANRGPTVGPLLSSNTRIFLHAVKKRIMNSKVIETKSDRPTGDVFALPAVIPAAVARPDRFGGGSVHPAQPAFVSGAPGLWLGIGLLINHLSTPFLCRGQCSEDF
jgi:hypothetical protein